MSVAVPSLDTYAAAPLDRLAAAGRRKLVGGQEDLLVDIALDLTSHTPPPTDLGLTRR